MSTRYSSEKEVHDFLVSENITKSGRDIPRADPFERFRLRALASTACLFSEAADLLDGRKGQVTVAGVWRNEICQQDQHAHVARASRDAMLARAVARAQTRLGTPLDSKDDHYADQLQCGVTFAARHLRSLGRETSSINSMQPDARAKEQARIAIRCVNVFRACFVPSAGTSPDPMEKT